MTKNIDEYLKKSKYDYYYDDRYATGTPPRCGKSVFQQGLNCSDEIVPGSNKRANRIRELMQEKILIGSENFTQQYSKIISEMHTLMKEELMLLNDDWTDREATLWLDRNVDFTHVKQHEIDGCKYLSVDPKIGDKYP